MEAFHTLRCRKFSFVQVIGRSGSNQIIGGRRVNCDDDDDDDDDEYYDDEVTKTGRDQDIYEHRHMRENLPTRLQV